MADEKRDHECCACVERLRRQNKESSDAWTRRCAGWQSELIGLRHLMEQAKRTHRLGDIGISVYGQAALAVALKEADEARVELEQIRKLYHQERRRADSLQDALAKLSEVERLQSRTPDFPERVGW